MPRYAAFISYSHADAGVARWLHHGLETYRFPRPLVGTVSAFGPVARRLEPIFRDREELPAAGDLGDKLRDALIDARHLIVICSPHAARSPWVNEEVRFFKAHHGAERVLALMAAGEPGHPELECFPPALRFRLDADGQVSDAPAEPIAADIRPGKDGRRLARLKLLAGLSGLPLDQLARRDVQRRQARLAWVAAAASLVAVVTAGLAVYANQQRIEATRQRDIAQSSLDFLINTFEIANPATENARTITALTVLDRASKRAAAELGSKPEVAARLLRTTGEIYFNLGLFDEAGRDLGEALRLTPEPGEAQALILLRQARLAVRKGDLAASEGLLDRAEASAGAAAGRSPAMAGRLLEQRAILSYLRLDLDRANAQFAEAARLFAAAGPAYALDEANVRANQGLALTGAKRFAEADRAFARAVDIRRGALGENHQLTALALHNRAFGLFEAGDSAGASALIARAVAVYGRVLEPNHPLVATSLLLEGRIHHREGDLAGAVAALSQAQAIYGRLYGPDNYQVGDAAFWRARALSDAGRYREALMALDATRRAYDASYGPDDPDQAELLSVRAQVLRASGDAAGAARDCAQELRLRARLDGAPGLAEARQRCATLAGPVADGALRFEPQAGG